MTRTFSLILSLSLCFHINNAFCSENPPIQYSKPNSVETANQHKNLEKPSDSNFWQKIWGKKARNALLLGMWSLHLDGTGEYLGNGSNKDQNHLLGMQVYGLSCGTFITLGLLKADLGFFSNEERLFLLIF